jgi:hypothetical protein
MVIQMRRLLVALVALSLGALALLGGPAVASASPRTAAPAGVCPGAPAYPPHLQATIMSSTTTPVIGQTIEASGVVYCPNENVDLTIGGVHVGTAHTDSVGSFDPPVVVPGPVGDKPLCGVGASGLSTDQDCLILHVRASNAGTTSNPPLGSTGAEVATLIAVAVVLLGGGALLVTAGRRRKSSV